MRFLWPGLVLVLIGAVAFVAMRPKTEPWCQLTDGATRVLDFRSDTQLTPHALQWMGSETVQSQATVTEGRWHWNARRRSDGNVQLDHHVEFIAPGALGPIGARFETSLGVDCAIGEPSFTASTGPEAKQLVDRWLELVTMSIEPNARRWRRSHKDQLGNYWATYRLRGDVMTRRRQFYAAPEGDKTTVQVVASRTDIELSPELWFSKIIGTEHLRVRRSGKLWLEAELSFRLGPSSDISPLAEPRSMPRYASPAPSPEPEQAGPPLVLSQALVKAAIHIDAGDELLAIQSLQRDFTKQPTLMDEVVTAVEAGSIPGAISAYIVAAMEAVATPLAERLLIRLASNDDAPEMAQLQAIHGLGGMIGASPAAQMALQDMAETALHADAVSALAAASVLALGGAYAQAERADAGGSERAARFLEALLDDEDHERARLAATSMANAHSQDFQEVLAEATSRPEPGVREGAIEALGAVASPGARSALLGVLDRTQRPQERTQAARSLANRGHAESLGTAELATLILELEKPNSVATAVALVAILGPHASKHEDVYEALVRLFVRRSEPAIRKAVGRFIPAGRLATAFGT